MSFSRRPKVVIITGLLVLLAFTLLTIYLRYRNRPTLVEVNGFEYADKNCSDFALQSEAQKFFEDHGGPEEDYYLLDLDKDGRVCESLP